MSLQQIEQRKITREPYTGEVIDLTKPLTTEDTKATAKGQATPSSGEPTAAPGFHNRPATRAGPYCSRFCSLLLAFDLSFHLRYFLLFQVHETYLIPVLLYQV